LFVTSTEIHVRISLNRNFATMSHALVRSLARNARFPGDWRVIFTVSLDTAEDFSSPLLSWAKDYPVEFRWVDRDLFESYSYVGTRLQCLLHEHTADVVLIMDADLLSVGPLTDLIETAATTEAVIARPAWSPPFDVDLGAMLESCGLPTAGHEVMYSGYPVASPQKYSPAYFSFGNVALSRDMARHMSRTFTEDVAFVESRYRSFFNDQIALCLNINRNGYAHQEMNVKFNMANGGTEPFPVVASPEAAIFYANRFNAILDRRIIHYAWRTHEFDKSRELDGWDNLVGFCSKTDIRGLMNVLLQTGFREIL
jgi:hypothetical protein